MGEQMIATIPSREADAQMIAEALRNYCGEIKVCKPCPINPKPPEPSGRIDPTTKLRRKPVPKPKEWKLTPLRAESLERAREARDRKFAARASVPDGEASQTELARRYGVSRSAIQYLLKRYACIDQVIAHLTERPDMRSVNQRNRKVLAQAWQA